MKPTLTVACISLKSAWQAVLRRSALTTLLLAPLAVAAAETNFLPNGGFEDETPPTISQFMQGWLVYGSPVSEISISDGHHHTGSHGLRISKGGAFCYGIPLHKEKDYTLSFWVKADGATPYLNMNMKDGLKQEIPGVAGQSAFDWRRIEIPLPAARRNYSYLGFYIMLAGTQTGQKADGAVWFDDVEILDANGKNLIPNASFEEPAFEIRNLPSWRAYTGQAYGNAKTGVPDVTRDVTVKHHGNASMRVAGNGNQVRIENSISLEPLRQKGVKQIRVAGWMRSEGMGERNAQLVIHGFKESNQILASVSGTSGWTHGEFIADLDTMGARLNVMLAFPNPADGVVWFDDIVVEEWQGDMAPLNLLSNTLFRQCGSHPLQPDYWGIRFNTPSLIKNWSHENFGLNDEVKSPVPRGRVLQLFYPPERDTLKLPFFYCAPCPITNLAPGRYTYSVYLKAKRAGTRVNLGNTAKSLAEWKVDADWKRYTVTADKNELSVGPGMSLPDPDSLVWMSAPQLEVGETVSEYRPAPSEIAEDISAPPPPAARKPTAAAADDTDLLAPALPLTACLEYNYYTDDRTAKARVEWNGLQSVRMRTELFDSGGVAVKDSAQEWDASGGGSREIEIPLKGLKDGVYRWRATALTAGAAKLEVEDRLQKLPANTIEVRTNRFTRSLEINRSPYFPLFLPLTPARISSAELALFKAQGFNTIANGIPSLPPAEILKNNLSPEKIGEMRRTLDRLNAGGFKLIFVLCWEAPELFSAPELRGQIDHFIKVNVALVNALKDHPAIIAWYALDEMSERWETSFGYRESDITKLLDAIRAADPYRPAFNNFNHLWNTEPYGKLEPNDIVCLDQYPFGYADLFDLDKLVPAAQLINDLNHGRRPSFAWLHGSYGPPETVREPRPYETRVQGWLYLVHGTRGIGYWANRPMNPLLWQEKKDLNRACAWLSENAFGPAAARLIKVALQKERIHYAVWVNGDKGYIFGINTSEQSVDLALSPERLFKRTVQSARRLFEDGQIAMEPGGLLEDTVPPTQRRAYEFDLSP